MLNNNEACEMSEDLHASDSPSSSNEEEEDDEEEEVASWISWFCSLKGNEFYCEVEEDYISDDFNLSGLAAQVPYYDHALDLILDSDSLQNEVLTEAQQEMVESAAEALYGLIHARYIITARGLNAMADKFRKTEFGRCPRVHCNGQACLPVGLSDVPGHSTVKLYCPKCEDIYYPRNKYHGNMDGAYFGTTFAHLFMMTFPGLRPVKPTEKYVPKAFGFKIHPTAWDNATDDNNNNNNNNNNNGGGSSRRQAVGGGGGGGANGITAAAAAAAAVVNSNSIKREHDEAGELQPKDKKGQSTKKK